MCHLTCFHFSDFMFLAHVLACVNCHI
uniref:Uncharacterized protein n=1 Tax=Rhizophora mucronata TaxID=61149 RepID=A0A2P2NWY7_RHIMU